MEENKLSVEFDLLKHQKDAVSGVDEIYAEENRFAGVKLPTGGGKSFVAMAEILRAAGNAYSEKRNDGIVNDASIMYVAPTNEILFQIQSNIAEFILKKDVDKMSRDEIIAVVKEAFPNLSLKCYATLLSESKKGELEEQNPDFIILDEAHRSGASGWQQAVAELVGCKVVNGEPVYNPDSKKKSKVLAISATPERDVDGKNMMDLWASALDNRSPEEIKERKHLGMDLDLDTAVREGIVVQPEVIHFDANLVDTPEYKRLVELYSSATGKAKDSLRKRLNKVNKEVIGIEDYDLLPPEEQEMAKLARNIEVIARAVEEGKIPEGGKMIFFTPENREIDGVKPTIPDFFKGKEEFIRSMLEKAGLDIDVSYLSCYLKDSENEANLNNFNKPVGELTEEDRKNGRKEPSNYKIIMATDKLNEGIHAKGITNSFMLRNLQEGENTNQRAQTILFLQQIGRTVFSILPGKDVKRPVIFDYANNFYTQNRDNPRKDKIEIFELTETQKMLIKEARMATLETYKSTAPINNRLPRLVDTLKILREYRFGTNNDVEFVPTAGMINSKTTLENLLDNPPLAEKKEEIIARLIDEGLYNPKKDYVIGKDLYDAKDSFWKGTKCFENYELEELVACGIIDTKSREGIAELVKYADKDFVDLKTGFIKMGAPIKFRNMNVYTGTEFDPEGKDFEGFFPGQFDELGYDVEGYDKNGFNRDGIHRETKTIHDRNGFMANGINIQTGTELDLLGYTSKQIKPVYDDRDVIVGGWDKDGYWHLLDSEGNFGCRVSKYSEGYEPKQDVHGFTPKGNPVGRKAKINDEGFYSNGASSQVYYDIDGIEHKNRNREGRDIDGYDIDGFDARGIHRDTGTRLDLKGRCYKVYVEAAKIIKKDLVKHAQALKIHPDGKFHYVVNGNEVTRRYNANGFTTEGINRVTGEMEDPFGFTMMDYAYGKTSTRENKYGFRACDVPRVVAGKISNSFYRRNYNILGTDREGKDRNGKLHSSLSITSDYILKCMRDGKPLKDFVNEYAISNKLLVPEAKRKLATAINQAVLLGRICPKLEISQEVFKAFYNATPEKVEEFMAFCPGLKGALKKDVELYKEELESIKEQEKQLSITQGKNKAQIDADRTKIDSLRRQNGAIRNKINAIEKIPEEPQER